MHIRWVRCSEEVPSRTPHNTRALQSASHNSSSVPWPMPCGLGTKALTRKQQTDLQWQNARTLNTFNTRNLHAFKPARKTTSDWVDNYLKLRLLFLLCFNLKERSALISEGQCFHLKSNSQWNRSLTTLQKSGFEVADTHYNSVSSKKGESLVFDGESRQATGMETRSNTGG